MTTRHVFDLDNTLIYTDSLNNDAYNHALNLTGLAMIDDCKRITRELVFGRYPNLDSAQQKAIIKLKRQYFIDNLKETVPNASLFQVLKDQNIELCILWTSAEKDRVSAILEYYRISSAFKSIVLSSKHEVSKDIDKMCQLFGCAYEDLTFYEDDQSIIKELQQLKLKVIVQQDPVKPDGVNSTSTKPFLRLGNEIHQLHNS